MADRLATHRRIRVAERAKAVVVFLKDVGVDGSDPDAQVLGVLSQRFPVVYSVPWNMQSDRGSDTSDLMYERGIGHLLIRISSCAGPGEDLETSARVAIAPRRGLDMLNLEGRLDHI